MRDYLLSLPERLLRSAGGLGGGAAHELGELLLPSRVRRSRLYQSSVGATLRFLIEEVGQIEGTGTPEEKLPPDFLVRRTAGNFVELAGLASFHASPVWVFAALADIAGAGREMLAEVSQALAKEGLLPPGERFGSMDELLDALERTAGCLTEAVNTPPLDVKTLREEWDELRREAARLPSPVWPVERLYSEWRELQAVAQAQDRTVLEVSSVMALNAVRELPENVRRLSRAARIGGKRVGAVVGAGLLDHYRKSLTEIREAGYLRYWLREFRPYLAGAVKQFSRQRGSTTQRFLARRRGNGREANG